MSRTFAAAALPYPNALQCRQTTAEQRSEAAAAVQGYASALERGKALLREDDAFLGEAEVEQLQRRVDHQAAANANAAQFRTHACDVVATAQDELKVTSRSNDERGGIDIFHAACDGDVAMLAACLQGGVHVNVVGQPDPVRYSGVQFRQRWLFRAPPLVFAAAFGRENAVHFLLEHDADPNLASSTGLRACDYAARRGYREIVRMLEEATPSGFA